MMRARAYRYAADCEASSSGGVVREFSGEHLRQLEREASRGGAGAGVLGVACSAIKVPGINRRSAQLQMLGALGGSAAADSFWGLGFLPTTVAGGGAGGGARGTGGGSTGGGGARRPRTSFAASDEEGSLVGSATRLHARAARYSFAESEGADSEGDAVLGMSITPTPGAGGFLDANFGAAKRAREAAAAAAAVETGEGSW